MAKILYVLERSNGWYGGYEKNAKGDFEQVFNTDAKILFRDMKRFVDKGYSISLIGVENEKEFMRGRTTLEEYVKRGVGRNDTV